jgi:hypothetical protein
LFDEFSARSALVYDLTVFYQFRTAVLCVVIYFWNEITVCSCQFLARAISSSVVAENDLAIDTVAHTSHLSIVVQNLLHGSGWAAKKKRVAA